MIFKQNHQFTKNDNSVYSEKSPDKGFILIVDENRDDIIAVTNIVKAIWIFLDTPKTYQEIQSYSYSIFNGDKEHCEKETDKILEQFLRYNLLTVAGGK